MLCGLLSDVTLKQQVTAPLGVWWWIWALLPPTLLVTGLLLGKRRGSRLYAGDVST